MRVVGETLGMACDTLAGVESSGESFARGRPAGFVSRPSRVQRIPKGSPMVASGLAPTLKKLSRVEQGRR
jgi:hypothetical protein